MSKIPKQLPNYVKRVETGIGQIVFQGVLYHVSSCTVIVSCHLLYIKQVPEKLLLHP